LEEYQDSVKILEKLISFKSISKPKDVVDWDSEWEEDYQRLPIWIRDLLDFYGIKTEIIEKNGVKNVVAVLDFGVGNNLVFDGHWDVVPPGNGWDPDKDPFKAKIVNGIIYGRGACDMKGALAVMLKVMIDLSKREYDLNGKVYLLAVGDEELGGHRGTEYVLDQLIKRRGITFDAAIVGEPTSLDIRIGRRGVIRIKIKVFGKQCHSARSDECENALYTMCEIVNRLRGIKIDEEVEFPFPPTAFNVTMVKCGVAPNVIPGEGEIIIDVRNTPSVDEKSIVEDIISTLSDIDERKYSIDEINVLAKPFKTDPNAKLIKILRETIYSITGHEPQLNALGGTSDARFFAYNGIPVAEVGVDDKTLHHANEWTSIDTMRKLEKIYLGVIKKFLAK